MSEVNILLVGHATQQTDSTALLAMVRLNPSSETAMVHLNPMDHTEIAEDVQFRLNPSLETAMVHLNRCF
jgi:hypothetical protein